MSALLLQFNGDPLKQSFPTYFAVYVFLFCLVVLYYLLLSPNVRALFIGAPLQRLLRWASGPDQQIRIRQETIHTQTRREGGNIRVRLH